MKGERLSGMNGKSLSRDRWKMFDIMLNTVFVLIYRTRVGQSRENCWFRAPEHCTSVAIISKSL